MNKLDMRLVWTAGILVIIVAVLAIFYTSGYRLSSDLSITKTGSIELTHLPENSVVFLDNAPEKRGAHGDTVIRDVTAGTHNVLVAKDGYWPWSKDLRVKEGSATHAAPFLLPQELTRTQISEDAEEYTAVQEAYRTVRTPTQENKTVQDGVALWENESSIFVEWTGEGTPPPAFCTGDECKDVLTVLNEAQDPIKHVDFLPGRNDIIVLSASNGVVALEIDTRKTQNLQPIYQGTDPTFFIYNDTVIVVDQNSFFRMNIN